jgi:hypothetical protein
MQLQHESVGEEKKKTVLNQKQTDFWCFVVLRPSLSKREQCACKSFSLETRLWVDREWEQGGNKTGRRQERAGYVAI